MLSISYYVPAIPASHIRIRIRVLPAFQYNGTIVEEDSNFAPIPQLSDTGGDIYLFVLSAGAVIFTEKTLYTPGTKRHVWQARYISPDSTGKTGTILWMFIAKTSRHRR